MPTITLEAVQAKQTELTEMIQQLQKTQQIRVIKITEDTIELRPGEHYSGAVLDADGGHLHHLVLMAPRPNTKLTQQGAIDWAESVDGDLPDRQEQALLYANCKPHLKPEWHWSNETHKDDASSAWICLFSHGDQSFSPKSYEGSAVAVRRV